MSRVRVNGARVRTVRVGGFSVRGWGLIPGLGYMAPDLV